jgi:HEAT repeat protein
MAFCIFLLAAGSFIIVRRSAATAQAKEDVIAAMLKLPAPPPPNPWMRNARRDGNFNMNNPPGDDAPIEDLMAFWSEQSEGYRDLRYNILPSGRSLDRILAEIEKDPTSVTEYLNILRDSRAGAEFAKRMYDNWPDTEGEAHYERDRVKNWLLLNSPFYTSQLAGPASQAADVNEYVSNQNELLALTQYDWERARPMVDRMYGDSSQPVSRVLAMWALYKHALDEGAIGDTDRYRDELKAVVEDKKAAHGMRDLAFDSLVKEKDWSGRDAWYFSLLEDETLADLRVNGRSYTGLTTIILYSPPEKYADKMIELVKSKNPVVRNAAARNLGVILDKDRPEVARALLPWLDDPKWATDIERETRPRLVQILQTLKLPESVPGLIAMLDEKQTQELRIPASVSNSNAMRYSANANAVGNIDFPERYELRSSANAMANAANYAADAANTASYRSVNMATTPFRGGAIQALGFQGEMRAVPALRRLLPETDGYELTNLVKALFQCRGFTVAEQVDALESAIRELQKAALETGSMDVDTQIRYGYANTIANMAANAVNIPLPVRNRSGDQTTVKGVLGNLILHEDEVSDELVRAVIDRISYYDTRDPKLAASLRSLLLKWKGTAINALLLRDLKVGKSSADAVVKLLTIRKELREKQPNDVYDLRTGVPAAVGISVCLLEDEADYAGMLASENTETKAAMFACARMIRAKLSVQAVAAHLRSPDKRLAHAAESYLESEDSPEARAIVLSLHPNEGKILGATTAFRPEGSGIDADPLLASLFASVNDGFRSADSMYDLKDFAIAEDELREEVKVNAELLGIYWYDNNFIRIYKDKVLLSWEDNPSRYRERTLEREEFENFKGFLSHHRVDELVPFIGCDERSECETSELLMLGKQGGRRVFVQSSRTPLFFVELESMFDTLRKPPSKLHYRLEKDIPGLEILFADENLSAETVWKNGTDFRLLVEDKRRGKAIEREIADAAVSEAEPTDQEISEIRQKRAYENYAWFSFGQNGIGPPAAQPEQAEFVPPRDGISPPAVVGGWKARSSGVEVRSDDDGLYKIAAGRVTKIRSGSYYSPVVTANGRWVLATKYTDIGDTGLVRINLLTNKEFRVTFGEARLTRALMFVPGLNKALVTVFGEEEYEGGYDGEELEGYSRPEYWLDVETGVVRPASGELRPLLQQTFRPLQPAANAFEFWAALPNSARNETAFGIYNTRTLKFTPRLQLPKINFNSMDMWADEAGGKLYFTYEGHLLAVPMSQNPTPR